MSFENKVILITGASAGIGAACAEYFAKEGALLALVGRSEEKFEKVIENIKESGAEAEPLVILADVTVDAERIVSETIEKYGQLDILVNNAAYAINDSIEASGMEAYDGMMATNVRAVLELTKLAVPHLIESKTGNIVNVSSVCGIKHIPNFLSYSMTKAALDNFTRNTAVELGKKGIRVNSVNPGFVDTDFHNHDGIERGTDEYTELMETTSQNYPLGRVGEVADCVNAIAFLANEKSNFINGAFVIVDGGMNLN